MTKFKPCIEESFPLETYPEEALANGGHPIIQVVGEDAYFVSQQIPEGPTTSSRHVARLGQFVTPGGIMAARLDVRMPPNDPLRRFVRLVTGSEFSPARACVEPIDLQEHAPNHLETETF